MGQPAARITDMHVCPMITVLVPHVGGPVIGPGVPTVLIGGLPAAVLGDMCLCVGPPDVIVLGSSGVLIGGRPAARMGDITAHGGVIMGGLPTVLIGEVAGAEVGNTEGMPIDMYHGEMNALLEAASNGSSLAEIPGDDPNKPKKKDTPPSPLPKKDSIAFKLIDQDGNPVEGEKCEVTLPDGSVRKVVTDKVGEIHIDNIDPGQCKISFTDIHGQEWS